ncbi:hypothetical protein [Candidatus Magnetobacterium casense]|uniref:Uncharacterized protein n=1 Tax=Candidatus Magnetobacterium casense TaxID=1455061 RepID=A0ABS6S281_9BACT|nr:hypothetical protein [Candidatus Magnetobacterium casensis]MBV6342715.1 hypothetical protein [Candidatus Magnetobacterium casensis]
MPVIREVCRRMGVTIRKVDHGFQFIRDEYIINWSPSTNRVSIQYRMSGHDRSIPFNKDGKPGKPRILIALEELVEIVRNEDRPRDKTS